MQDRFRLRVWDTELNKYLDDNDITLKTQGHANNVYELGAPHFDDKELVFEQCTGLKDRTGALIYEGDIIVDEYWDAYTKEKLYSVEFDNNECASFYLHRPNDDYYTEFYDVYLSHVKVIGNIHEYKKALKIFNENY